MSNAAKHRKKAAEFEQLKQIDRAIASYVRAIEESESDGEDVDVALLNKVGDLALRQGRVPDAVTYYERAVEHYATAGLFNNAIALCNKILRNAPGRSNVYFTLGRICARKGLRGDATRNFLEYAARMQQEGRVEEAMRALGEVADLMPELTEVRRLVDEHAVRAGVALPRRRTPLATEAVATPDAPRFAGEKSPHLVFLEVDYLEANARLTPPIAPHAQPSAQPARGLAAAPARAPIKTPPIVLPFIDLDVALEQTPRPAPDYPLEPSIELEPSEPEDVSFVELPKLDLLGLEVEAQANAADDVFNSIAELPMLNVPALDWRSEHAPGELVTLEPMELGDDDLSSIDLEPVLIDHIEFGPVSVEPEPTLEAFIESPIELTVDTSESDKIVAALSDDVDHLPLGSNATVADDFALQETANAPALAADVFSEGEPQRATPIATPAVAVSSTRLRTPLSASPIPAIEAAIAAGTEAAARAAAERPITRRPPFRLDPHDFILPGELPPLLVDDALVDAGLHRATASATSLPTPIATVAFVTPDSTPRILQRVETPRSTAWVDPLGADHREIDETHAAPPAVPPSGPVEFENDAAGGIASDVDASITSDSARENGESTAGESVAITVTNVDGIAVAPDVDAGIETDAESESAGDVERELRDENEAVRAAANQTGSDVTSDSVRSTVDQAWPGNDVANSSVDELFDEDFIDDARDAVRMTPSLPIAAVAAEANVVAESRRDELRAAVAESPQDWALRRRLAEALFEAGQREAALAELEASLTGFVSGGQIADGADISEVLVGVSPERVSYHQKRVELAVRLNDQQRLRFAYLDLADALVRSGEEGRAQAVYVRVLEIDPLDDRARAALGSAAPPPPAPEPTAVETGFVNLSDWLRDDAAPVSTRMRMREPVVSGDEQADFAALLRHFKDGVSRSLGDDDFESRYDLGVAFKEMGLLDDAIGEFQKALRSKTHRLPAYEALGQCFVEQGRYQVAATVLSRALHEPGLNDDQRVGVLYLLAFSCEALQRWGEARSYFQRVYSTDINFRDVAARLAALEQVAS